MGANTCKPRPLHMILNTSNEINKKTDAELQLNYLSSDNNTSSDTNAVENEISNTNDLQLRSNDSNKGSRNEHNDKSVNLHTISTYEAKSKSLYNEKQKQMIEMLTEPHFKNDLKVQSSKKNFFVYRVQLAELTGAPMVYVKGDNGFFRVVFALLILMYILSHVSFIVLLFAKCWHPLLHSSRGLVLGFIAIANIVSINCIFCCSTDARIPPWSRVLLAVAAISWGYIMALVDVFEYTYGVGKGVALTTFVMAIICFILAQFKVNFQNNSLLLKLSIVVILLALLSIIFRCKHATYDRALLTSFLIFIFSFWCGICIPIETRMLIEKMAVDIGNRDYYQSAFMIFSSYLDVILKYFEINVDY